MRNTLRRVSRSLPFASVPLLVLAAGILGCSTHDADLTPKPPLSESAKAEGRFFGEVSAFYCANFRWPTSWSELEEFQLARGAASALLDEFSEPLIQSPRAIVLNLSYLDKENVRRKASFIAPPSCDPNAKRKVDRRKVTMAGDGVAFTLPNGFSLMKSGEIAERWKSPPFPDAAWQRDDESLIAVRFGDLDLTDEEVAESLDDMVEAYESSVPSLVWRGKSVVGLSGKSMLRHEFESTSSQGRIVNVVYTGSYNGRLFAVTITGPIEVADELSRVALEVEETLVVR
jgi:hypothetical protein